MFLIDQMPWNRLAFREEAASPWTIRLSPHFSHFLHNYCDIIMFGKLIHGNNIHLTSSTHKNQARKAKPSTIFYIFSLLSAVVSFALNTTVMIVLCFFVRYKRAKKMEGTNDGRYNLTQYSPQSKDFKQFFKQISKKKIKFSKKY